MLYTIGFQTDPMHVDHTVSWLYDRIFLELKIVHCASKEKTWETIALIKVIQKPVGQAYVLWWILAWILH